MRKILIISSLILGCISIQAQENKFEYRQTHPEYFADQIKKQQEEKNKIKKESFLNCVGKKEGDIIEMEFEDGEVISLKCTLVALPIKKGF